MLLFLHQNLILEGCLQLCCVVSLFHQHLLHIRTAGLALLQAALQFALLHFGGDQLENKSKGWLGPGIPCWARCCSLEGKPPCNFQPPQELGQPSAPRRPGRFRARHFGRANQGAEGVVHSSEFTSSPSCSTRSVFLFTLYL